MLRAEVPTQKLQPLIWLARRWTSSSVLGDTPPLYVAFISSWMAAFASGMMTAGFFILGSIVCNCTFSFCTDYSPALHPSCGLDGLRCLRAEPRSHCHIRNSACVIL